MPYATLSDIRNMQAILKYTNSSPSMQDQVKKRVESNIQSMLQVHKYLKERIFTSVMMEQFFNISSRIHIPILQTSNISSVLTAMKNSSVFDLAAKFTTLSSNYHSKTLNELNKTFEDFDFLMLCKWFL